MTALLLRILSRPKIRWDWKVQPEERLTIEIADYLRAQCLEGKLNAVWFHPSSEGKRHPITGIILRAMGTHAGIPDLVIIGKGWSLLVELKTPKAAGKAGGKMSPGQNDFQEWCGLVGVQYVICRSLDEFIGAIGEMR